MISFKTMLIYFFFFILFNSFAPISAETACDISCFTCSGPSNAQCLTCKYKYYFQNGMCLLNADFLSDLTSGIKISDQLYFFWTFNTNSTVTMAFRWNFGGYMALGFGNSMSGMDVISAEITNNQINVNDRWSSSQSMPSLDSDIGGSNDLILQNFVLADAKGFAIVKFNRALNSADSRDYVIQQKYESFTFAFSSQKTIDFHGSNLYYFSFNFTEGLEGQATITEPNKSALIKAHGIGLLIAWSFLVDIGLIVIRYFKNFKHYILVHTATFIIVDFFTLIIVFWVIGKNGDSFDWKFQSDKTITAHFAIGVVVLNILVVQHIVGIIITKVMEAKKFNAFTSKLPSIKNMHKITGYILYLLTKASVLSGIWIYNYIELFIGFAIYFGVLLVFRVLFEIFHGKLKSKNTKNVVNNSTPVHISDEFKGLLKELEEHKTPFSSIAKKNPKLKWCLLSNSLYDLKNFDHPGGNFIIEEIYGREIGRFYFGAFALENMNMKPYNHKVSTKKLLDKMFVGDLLFENINILEKIPSQEVASIWTLANKTKLTKNVSKIEFNSKANRIKNHVKGVEWFGRHFTVLAMNESEKLRLYTTVLSQTEENIVFRRNLIDFFEQKISSSSENPIILSQPATISQNLPLIIKRYDFPNTLSSLIHNSNINEKFEIQGPLGPGLELTANSNGNHIIFCGGTGILPFIDLFDYLLRKSIYQALFINLGKDVAEETNTFNEDYENTFGSKFKVMLFAAFQSKDELEYLDFIITLFNINKKYNLNYFDMILRFTDKTKITGIPTTNNYFDEDFFKANVIPDQCSRVFVCGNPAMNKLIPELCSKNQIEKEKIHLV